MTQPGNSHTITRHESSSALSGGVEVSRSINSKEEGEPTLKDFMSKQDDEGGACSQGVPPQEFEEDEQEDMFVTADPSLGVGERKEWGGPRRGGRYEEPTRFGDWERKGRCTDF